MTNNGYAHKLGGLAHALDRETSPVDPKNIAAIVRDLAAAIQEMHARIEKLEAKSCRPKSPQRDKRCGLDLAIGVSTAIDRLKTLSKSDGIT